MSGLRRLRLGRLSCATRGQTLSGAGEGETRMHPGQTKQRTAKLKLWWHTSDGQPGPFVSSVCDRPKGVRPASNVERESGRRCLICFRHRLTAAPPCAQGLHPTRVNKSGLGFSVGSANLQQLAGRCWADSLL